MNKVTITAGDAIALLKNVREKSVHLVIADPPYNLGKDYGNASDKRGYHEYLEFTRAWLAEVKRVLHPQGTVYVFMGVRFIASLYEILEREMGLLFNSWIVWHYTQGLGKTKGFSPRHDDVLMFTKSARYVFNLDSIRVPQKYYRERNNMRGANPGDVWQFSHVHYSNPNRQPHPTQKPEGLIERMVLASSNPGDVVLDPFAGSGTTLRVCQQLDRRAVGFELNPAYVELTRRRLAAPFSGFDSVDPRMERVPNDLRNPKVRRNYLRDHMVWFLNNHENAQAVFRKAVLAKYGEYAFDEAESHGEQAEIFDNELLQDTDE